MRCWRSTRAPPSGRASRRAGSGRNRAASPRAVRFRRGSRTWRRQAGLTAPIVYGGADSKSYIIEVVGCGVAWLDFDNDGWLDLFVLSGTRLDGAAGECHQSPVQEQSRRHVHRRDRECRLDADRLGIGGDRRRLRQRRLRRPVHHLLRPERSVSQQRRRHVHRRDREGGAAAAGNPLRLGLHVGRLRPGRPPRSVCCHVSEYHAGDSCRSRERTPIVAGRGFR